MELYCKTCDRHTNHKYMGNFKDGKPLFWRNDVIGAWCIVGSAGNKMDVVFGTDNEFWIGIYDDNAKTYAGKFRVHLTSYGGMCSYKFNQFFREKDIQCDNDLRIQEKFLGKINELIDFGILSQR